MVKRLAAVKVWLRPLTSTSVAYSNQWTVHLPPPYPPGVLGRETDNICPRLLKGMVDAIAPSLAILFKKSMNEGTVPSDWKTANVTPIFKKGSRSDPGNYRPISLTSVPGKIMETLVKEEMLCFLNKNCLIKRSQHGFVKGKSCTTNLLEYLETVTDIIDRGGNVDVVYLDFSKAFDMVPTARLLEKVKSHGIMGKTNDWLRAWLTNRTQRVILNGSKSGLRHVTSGVPQGSGLGPILFLIYINDLEDNFEGNITMVKKFADDTKVAQKIANETDRDLLQNCLNHLEAWGKAWGMKFNTGKCHVLHMGRTNPKYHYTLGNEELASVEEERDLGVIIEDSLKTGSQCERAARSANGVLSQILRAFSYRDKITLPAIFKMYVRPYLEFATPAWNPYRQSGHQCIGKSTA